jgi:hypothetical protein
MGGYGSTRWGGHVRRRCIGERTGVLRVRDLVDEATIAAVEAWEERASSPDVLAGTVPLSPPPTLSTLAAQGGTIRVTVTAPARAELTLEPTPQPFGGVRWWVRCPTCWKRRAALYAVPAAAGGHAFGCRPCLRLVYYSQRCEPAVREQLTQQRIARRLGDWVPENLPDLPDKPPRMHWSTYNRLADAFEVSEERRLAALHTRTFARMLDRYAYRLVR